MWKRAEVFFFDWIRFGDLSLQLLLERVEDYCRDEDLERRNKGWVEGGRRGGGGSGWNDTQMRQGSFYFALLWLKRKRGSRWFSVKEGFMGDGRF